jgi:glutaredoxin
MKKVTKVTTAALVLLACASGAMAQVYKWVDANGVVHYTDTPPPRGATPASMRPVAGAATGVALPYELAEAVRHHPLTLFTADACTACDEARSFLKARAVPFAEKTVKTERDLQALKQAGSNGGLPLLLVGRTPTIGFESAGWNNLLRAAAYPDQRQLPARYRFPAPVAAAPVPAPAVALPAGPDAAALAEAAAEERRNQEALRNAAPGFRF